MLVISLVLTLLNSVFNEQVIQDNEITYKLEVFESVDVFYYLSYVHLALNTLILVAWVYQSGPLAIMDEWRAVCSRNIKLLKQDVATNKKKK